MKASCCGQTAEQREARRLHYCGTCKTLGSVYGQRSRLTLNHDTVFLGELLSLLAEESHQKWSRPYQSYNCLSLPRSERELPFPLRFAAAANVALTEFKIRDHLSDTGKVHWKWAHKLFSKSFLKAQRELSAWKFPVESLWRLLERQNEYESEMTQAHSLSADAALCHLAEPTATATAMFFEQGAIMLGKDSIALQMYQLGENFGRLIYILDAFEDYEQDARRNEFNALRASFKWDSQSLTPLQRQQIIEILNRLKERIVDGINELPIPQDYQALFIARLQRSLAEKLRTKLPVLKVACHHTKLSLSERWHNAVKIGRAIAKQELTTRRILGWVYAPTFFVLVMIIAFVFPHQIAKAKSLRECFDVSLNLAAIGSAFVAIPSLIATGNYFQGDANTRQKRNICANKCKDCHDSCCNNCCGDCCSNSTDACCDGCCDCGCEACSDNCHCGDSCCCCDGCDCGH